MSTGDQLELYLWVLYALALGSMVGFERELRGHEAGIRTTALVCGGSALFGLVSLDTGDDRIAAAVVQGVGIIGAGLVVQRAHNIRGVTTAATVWMMGAVGLIVANEWWLLALLTTATMLILLELAPVSEWLVARAGGTRPLRTPDADGPPGDASPGP